MHKFLDKNIFGTLIIIFTALYGIHIYGQIILFESKGFLPSTFVAIWILLFIVFIFNNSAQQIIGQSVFHWYKSIILLFLGYYFCSFLLMGDNSLSTHLTIFTTIILPGFMMGIVSNLNYNKFFPFQKFVKAAYSDINLKRIYFFTCFLVIIVFFFEAYLFYKNKIELTLNLITVNNEFYQDFGDYFIIFYCGWLALTETYRNRLNEAQRNYISFTFFILLEMIFSVVFLQLIGSNKAPLTIVLIGLSYLFFSIPSDKRLRRLQLYVLCFFAVLLLYVFYILVDPELLASLRFFGETKEVGLASNSSITSRIDQFVETGYDQISRSWFFGDLSIKNYIHSSLVTIQTHLGIIGTMLFWFYIFINGFFIYFKSSDRISKSITIPILFVSIISSAFWWLPLWFLIGFIYMKKHTHFAYGVKS